ncbi:MAG: ComF family protein [Thermomicrobiales bacterium]|nr:ComF family protein [Thermomicrobiales bacterium]
MKFQGEPARAAHLASLLDGHARSFASAEAIVPVPIHPNRLRERGFNQSDLLAREVGRANGMPVWSALVRVRDTRHQVDLTDDERVVNVRGAFDMRDDRATPVPASVILLDDVFTTGSTMDACARTLLHDGGVERVYGLSLC